MNQVVERAAFQIGDWVWIQDAGFVGKGQAGKVIEACSLWGAVSYRVWLVQADTVINVNADKVSSYTACRCCQCGSQPARGGVVSPNG